MQTQIFKGLKVIELASVLAGPAVGLFFAELGAEVIKIENQKTGGDMTRHWRLPSEDKDYPFSAYYYSVNWNKQVEMLDLSNTTDQVKVHQWIKEADIVISNFKTSSAQKLQMDYETLKMLNPKLIFAHLTAFGANENRPAFDMVLQAEAGFLYMCGEQNRSPVKMPVALIDILAAHQLKEGILIALLQRYQTGKGSYVTTSLLEAAVASLANQATNWLMEGFIPQPIGLSHPNIAPYGDIFYTKDGQSVVLAVGTDGQFKKLCSILNQPNLANDDRFNNNAQRVIHRKILKATLEPLFKQMKSIILLPLCHENGVPIGSVRNMKEVFELPKAQEMILRETLPDGKVTKRVRTVAFHVKLS